MYRSSAALLLLALAGVCADLFAEDGVLVEAKGEIRTIAGLWTVFIIIHPSVRPDTETWTCTLEKGISRVGAHVSAPDREVWIHRMAALHLKREVPFDALPKHVPVANPTGHPRRLRRGLFNFVGKLSKSLFGTATQEDLQVLMDAIQQTRSGMEVLHHNTKEMLSILNQTRRYVGENRMDLRVVQQETTTLSALANANAQRTQALEVYMGQARIQRCVDLALQQMELALRDYHLQERIFHRQKLQMERGWLTEDILPPTSLADILRKFHTKGYHTLPLEWYYQHMHVTPSWSNSTELAFRTMIPALSPSRYLRYGLQYFDIPFGPEHLRRIIGRDDLAINTMTGATFVPTQCVGQRPLVCRPVYECLQCTCEGSLVSGESSDGCRVSVSKRGNRTSEVFQAEDCVIVTVVAYVSREVALRCRGHPAVRWTVVGPRKG